LAVVVTIAKGYDLGYIWKTQDRTAEPAVSGYYLDAVLAGEPPGRWWGPGAQALGLTPGQAVERTPTTRSTGRPTRAPALSSAGPAAATRPSPTIWPG
jgi:hypothetical protein